MVYGYHSADGFLQDTRIGSTTSLVNKSNLLIEDNVFIGQYNFIEASNGIIIREGCQITNYISIISHSSHNSIRYYGKRYRQEKNLKGYVKGQVEIGKYSFIGPHSTILPGTKIGKGCIVSAYSLLKGDYPDFSIVSGNPAVVVGNTKTKDEDFFKSNPELKKFYEEWVNE